MDTFSLSAAYSNNSLTITLKGFVDWAIIRRNRTQESIGGEINRKMDVLDVYTAFSQTQPQCDEENMKDKNKLKKYEFGTIVENEKLPCFKIEREGKITVYWNITDMKTKKLVAYESKLCLTKIKDMAGLRKNSFLMN